MYKSNLVDMEAKIDKLERVLSDKGEELAQSRAMQEAYKAKVEISKGFTV